MIKSLQLGVLIAVWSFASTVQGQNLGGFGDFKEEPINAPGQYRLIDDPTSEALSSKVYSFTISPGVCSDEKYDNGNSDCSFNSVRTQLYEQGRTQPPGENWYQWQMYLPEEFPLGERQSARGLYNFAYFHNGECPHLSFTTETLREPRLFLQINHVLYDKCLPQKYIDLGAIEPMRGAWHRFELAVLWSTGDDGYARVFIDGNRVADYQGHTLVKEYSRRAYFKFGIYLCCTEGVEKVREATNYFTGIQRGRSSSELYSSEERELARQLQEALNALDCDVGAPDGIAGRRTREMAQTCRPDPSGTLPQELVASNVGQYLEFYRSQLSP
jgi:hypothetical protein